MQTDQKIFESLFHRNYSDPGNKHFLEELTEAHPYFSPARFFLLQQATEGTETFEKQAAKTNIFFNNPHWLNFRLQQLRTGGSMEVVQPTRQPVEVIPSQPEEKEMNPEEEQPTTPVVQMIDTIEETQMQSAENTGSEEIIFRAGSEELIETNQQHEDNSGEAAGMEKEIEPLKIELKLPEEKNSNGNDLLFEPMHLVDYFASQGIKLSEEIQTTDKLGRQLKSFTEWLKTMKKVHAVDQEPGADQTDQAVETLAEISNIENEVLTEAMAEVFAKQGKTVKATELYQKLSLLNPAKSAYFAAKIENLKGV